MKTPIHIILLAIIIVLPHAIAAQNTGKANKLYNRLGYQVAIPHYGDSEDLSTDDMIRLATAYRLTGQSQETEMLLRRVIGQDKEPIYVLHFAQALLMNDKIEESLEYFGKYTSLLKGDSNDQRGNNFIEFLSSDEYDAHKNIEINNVDKINTDNYEFSPFISKDGVLFISSRPNESHNDLASLNYQDFGSDIPSKDIWTEKDYNKLYLSSIEANGNLNEPSLFSSALSDKLHTGPVHLNRNGDLLYFTSSHTLDYEKKTQDVISLEIYISVKTEEGWSLPVSFSAINKPESNEAHPSVSKDGQTIIFSSDRLGGHGGMDLYMSTKSDGQWSEPFNLGEQVNTPGNELFPFIHENGKLYFSSDGLGGFGGLDIHSIEFRNNALGNSLPSNVGFPMNSNKDDFGYVSDKEDKKGYFSSSRATSLGRDDIYSFVKGEEVDDVEEIKEIEIEPVVEEIKEVVVETSPVTTPMPAAPEPMIYSNKVVEAGLSFELDKIYYDFNKANLRSTSFPELEKLRTFMVKHPEVSI